MIGCLGQATAQAVEAAGLRLDFQAGTAANPSIVNAIEKVYRGAQRRSRVTFPRSCFNQNSYTTTTTLLPISMKGLRLYKIEKLCSPIAVDLTSLLRAKALPLP